MARAGRMRIGFVPTVIGALVGLLVILGWHFLGGAGSGGGSDPTSLERSGVGAAGPADPSGEVAELRARLAAEAEARGALAREMESLREDLESLRERWLRAEREAAEEESFAANMPRAHAGEPSFFDERELTELGIGPSERAELRQRYEQAELDRLYLRDQAAREGWIGGTRYRRELSAMRAELQDELGSERFDLMTYAAGNNNRVVIRDVIGESVAAEVGLQSGDLILAYAGRRVFGIADLRALTTTGMAGEQVILEIERRGRSLDIAVPRGPLGVRLQGIRVLPERVR